jgi:hypothetical protein
MIVIDNDIFIVSLSSFSNSPYFFICFLRMNSFLLQTKHALRYHSHRDDLRRITLLGLVDIRQKEVRKVVKQPLHMDLANQERVNLESLGRASRQSEDIAIYVRQGFTSR